MSFALNLTSKKLVSFFFFFIIVTGVYYISQVTDNTTVFACSDEASCQQVIGEANKKREELEEQQKGIESKTENLRVEVENILQQISTYANQINATDAEIARLSDENIQLEKSIAETDALLRKRLVVSQLSFETNEALNFIANASSISEMVERSNTIEQLTESDNQLIKKFDAQNNVVLENKAAQEKHRIEVAKLKSEQETLQQTKQTQIEEYNKLYAESERAEVQAEEDASSAQENLEEINRKIAEQEAARKAAGVASSGTPVANGEWSLPIASGVYRSCEVACYARDGYVHNGTDMATGQKNLPIYAIKEGVVVKTGSDGSYGNTVAIAFKYEGKWMTALYAHLSEIHVSVGQKVSKSEQLGVSGNTGYSTGPHLHFEIAYAYGTEADPQWQFTAWGSSKILDPTVFLSLPYSW